MRWCYLKPRAPEIVFFGAVPGFAIPCTLAAGTRCSVQEGWASGLVPWRRSSWTGGVPGPGGTSRYAVLTPCSAFRFLLTFASRSGSSSGAIVLGCFAGPWRFTVSVVGLFGAGHREGRRMRIQRDIPNGYGVEARESFWIRAPKAAVLRS